MQLGRILWQLPPGKDNPRNSEGAFLSARDGSLVYVYSRYSGSSGHDAAQADIAIIRSADHGLTWSAPRILFACREIGAMNLMSVSLLRMQNGDMGMFFLIRRSGTDLRLCFVRSGDEGETWSPPRLCMDMPLYYVVNNDRVVRLSTGRILIPAAFHFGGVIQGERMVFDSRAEVQFFASDDDGATFFQLPGRIPLPGWGHSQSGMQEPGVVELADGTLWCFARTDLGRQYESFSRDGGASWTPAQPSQFSSPCSPMSIKRAPDGALVALYNPVPTYDGWQEAVPGFFTGNRHPLALRTSWDEGKTWTPLQTVEDDPTRAYCYCAIHFTEGMLYLGYCAGGPEDGTCLSRTVIRRIPWQRDVAE